MKRLIVNLLIAIVVAISTIGCGKESTDTVKYDDQAFFDKYDFAGYPIAELKNLEVIGEDFSLFTLSDGVRLHTFIQGEENGKRWFGIFRGIHLIQYWKDDISNNPLQLAEIEDVIYTPEWAYIIVSYSKNSKETNYCPRIDAIYFDTNKNSKRTHFVDYKSNTNMTDVSQKWPAAIYLWSKNSVVVTYAASGSVTSAEVINFTDDTVNILPKEAVPSIYYGLFINHKEDCYTVFDINANLTVTGYKGYTTPLPSKTYELFTPWLSDPESPTYSITSYSSSYYSQSLMVDIKQTRSNGNTTEKELDFDANNYIGDLYSVEITVDDKTLGTYSSWQ